MSSIPAHLSIILDLSPANWQSSADIDPPLSLRTFLSHVLVFINAHLALKNENSVSVFGALPRRSMIFYPPSRPRATVDGGDGPDENTYYVFREANEGVMRSIRDEVESVTTLDEDEPVALVGALTKSLCYINRLSNPPAPLNPSDTPPTPPQSRVLLFSVSPDSSTAYIPFMNCIFSAQKLKVAIDVLKLDSSDTIFLHQACHLTGGGYVYLEQRDALLQYLSMCFLSGMDTRQVLGVPSQDKVDFRAACFCHKEIVDIGYVCSVCLSIFCHPIQTCSTCQTHFSPETLIRFSQTIHGQTVEFGHSCVWQRAAYEMM